MVFVRTEFYNWAKESETLLGLCRGDYDIFCDNSYKIKQENEETCVGDMEKLQIFIIVFRFF